MPNGYTITTVHLKFAEEHGLDSRRAHEEFEKFADFHRAKGSAFADWDAAWRNWVRIGVNLDKPKRDPRVATTIPDDFVLTTPMIKYAREKAGWNADSAKSEFESFRSHHKFKGTLGKDWVAGWQTWVGMGIKFANERTKVNGRAPDPNDPGSYWDKGI
jgi:hypothetical protein